MSDKKKYFKIIGPLLILAIPIAILLAIFFDGHYNTNVGDYEPEGIVTYSLTNPEEYGLTGEETPND